MPEETGGFSVVTGAFGYTGRYITRRLLEKGLTVRTVTGHPNRPSPFGNRVSAALFNFENPGELVRILEGADVLYNTYWIRFPRGHMTFEKAIDDSKTLIRAAEEAGVKRIVHISVTNARSDSPLPYFRGKGELENDVKNSKLSYAIIRPTVAFGNGDVLVNNIAWFIRRFPVFPIFGQGDYRIQPVFVEDMAQLAVMAGRHSDNMVMDAVGPETFTFEEMVRLIAERVGSRTKLVKVSPALALFLSKMAGHLVGDAVLTRDEIDGLMANLLVSQAPPTGETRLSQWLEQNSASIGTSYASELGRHYK